MFSDLDSFSSWKLTVIKFIPLLHVRSNWNDMGLIRGRFNYSSVTSLKQLLNWKKNPFFWLPIRSAPHKRGEATILLTSSKTIWMMHRRKSTQGNTKEILFIAGTTTGFHQEQTDKNILNSQENFKQKQDILDKSLEILFATLVDHCATLVALQVTQFSISGHHSPLWPSYIF